MESLVERGAWDSEAKLALRLERGRVVGPGPLPHPPASSSEPASDCSISAASRTRRVIGPTWSSDPASGTTPRVLTRPNVGLRPTMPQHAAGWRIDPPVSEPMAP